MRRLSKKRAAQNRQYITLRLAFLSKNKECVAQITPYCDGQATDIHHMRGRIGDKLTDPEDFLPVCRSCHHWIENNPSEAKRLGFSKSRLGN